MASKQLSPMTSNREVARVVGISHPSVQKVVDRALALELDSARLEAMSDSEIAEAFYPKSPGHPAEAAKADPDFSALVKELGAGRKYGLTRYLLWCEYQDEVGPDAAYGYSSFCTPCFFTGCPPFFTTPFTIQCRRRIIASFSLWICSV